MPFRALFSGLILSLSFICLNAAPDTGRTEFYYGIAEGNYLIGDLSGAERGIQQMLRIDPDYLPALTLKARVMLDQNKTEQALAAAERAIDLDPQNFEHTLLKALILGHMQRRDEAGTLIKHVIAQAPPTSDDARAAHQLLGLLLMAEAEWDQAAAAFGEIYQADATTTHTSLRLSSEAYLEKARSQLQAGAHDQAIAAVDQAIAVYQDQTGQESLRQSTALRLMRARLLSQIGRFEDAIKDLQALTGQQPQNFEALITLASLYASVERWESLEAVIEPIANRPELRDVALYLEGRAALAKDRVGTARAKFEAAIDALPEQADQLRRSLFFYRGICLDKLDRRDEADAAILNAIDAGFRPETRDEAMIAGQTLLRADRSADAIPLLEAITLNRIAPGAEIWAMLGRAHLAADTPTLALSAFNESLKIDPKQAATRALRGSLLRKIGDLAGALADYEAALLLAPDNIAAAYACGLVQLQMGEIIQAEQVIGLAALQLEAHAGLQLLHALLAYTIHSPRTAQASLKRYQALVPKTQNASARYLQYLLQLKLPAAAQTAALDESEVGRYFKKQYTRKQTLDQAGRADSPAQARQQICAAAFWMAQYELAGGNTEQGLELLQIAFDTGNPDLTEYQLARWQLKQLAQPPQHTAE